MLKQRKAWYQKNKTKMADQNRIRKFGVSVEEYERMLVEQGGGCKICGNTNSGKRLAVDHDHQTGQVRGLLCSACNVGLGMFKDSTDLLRRAINHLTDQK